MADENSMKYGLLGSFAIVGLLASQSPGERRSASPSSKA